MTQDSDVNIGLIKRHSGEGDREQASDLLRRYPQISNEECEVLLQTLRQLSNVDIALMLSDSDISPKLKLFRSEHKHGTKIPFRDYAALIILGIIGLLLLIYEVLPAG